MLKLFNTLTRQKEVFVPIQKGHVRLYVCGVTVYDFCHIGHARMLVAFDVVYRWLLASGYQVTYVRNVTDIDDKIIQRASHNNESIESLTGRFKEAMWEDCGSLYLLKPTMEPCATDHVDQMIRLIKKLIEQNLAYVTDGGDVCFSISDFASYGQLSGKTVAFLGTESRIQPDPTKRNPLDFVLWKPSKSGEPSWPSPWGQGRPGWHIECSAMSSHYLGESFDIHGGGSDLTFPHHENEIAQSQGANPTQKRWVNYWLHNGFVKVDAQKMSKSLHNFLTIRDALKLVNGEVLRFFLMRSHYRSAINYTENALQDAQQSLAKLYTALRLVTDPTISLVDWSDTYPAAFKEAMDDDFNTPEAVAILFRMTSEIHRTNNAVLANQLQALANSLGLLQSTPDTFFQQKSASDSFNEAAIEAMIQKRHEARTQKNWLLADRIRQNLLQAGIELEDDAKGFTRWKRCL